MKQFKGIKNPTFRQIKRNRDENGNILTYSVDINGIEFEYNTLSEARLIAIVVD